MINDCAFVGETLLKYMGGIDKVHLKRSRSFLDKTFKLALKIALSRGDVYHVHYLLQDSFLTILLGKKPIVCHAHGSDLRASLNHNVWGRMVRYNLTYCDKVLVSTPDILDIARRYRKDAEYLPNPVDETLFYPKPLERSNKVKVLIASDSNWEVKGTDIALKALSKVKEHVEVSLIGYGKDLNKSVKLAKSLGLNVNILPKVPHEKLNEYYWSHDVVLDQFKLGSLGVVSLEAIASGRPVVTYVSSKYREYEEFPLKDVNTEEEIANAILDADEKLWIKEYEYLKKNHNPRKIAEKVLSIYESISSK